MQNHLPVDELRLLIVAEVVVKRAAAPASSQSRDCRVSRISGKRGECNSGWIAVSMAVLSDIVMANGGSPHKPKETPPKEQGRDKARSRHPRSERPTESGSANMHPHGH